MIPEAHYFYFLEKKGTHTHAHIYVGVCIKIYTQYINNPVSVKEKKILSAKSRPKLAPRSINYFVTYLLTNFMNLFESEILNVLFLIQWRHNLALDGFKLFSVTKTKRNVFPGLLATLLHVLYLSPCFVKVSYLSRQLKILWLILLLTK